MSSSGSNSDGEGSAASEDDRKPSASGGDNQNSNEQPDPMTDISDPRETDVLCGRGGAALRHPGNQTYRRLVTLNKGLYITCLKTEKLKISRSIVAAIREQKGRFLERDSKKGTWYDIGDKKAIEKTSQALREGQPKLRAKMVEMGQIPPDQGVNPQQQQQQQQQQQEESYNNGIYATRQPPSINSLGGASMGSMGYGGGNSFGMDSMGPMGPMGDNMSLMANNMPPPSARTLSNDINMQNEMAMMQRLSLTGNVRQIPSWTPSINSMSSNNPMDDGHMMRSNRGRFRPGFNSRGGSSAMGNDMGMGQSNMSMMSNFSAFGADNGDINGMMNQPFPSGDVGSMGPPQFNNDNHNVMTGNHHPYRQEEDFTAANGYDQKVTDKLETRENEKQKKSNVDTKKNEDATTVPPPPPPPSMSPFMESSPAPTRFDRRRFFANMHGGQKQSKRNIGGEWVPDIHMVDSQYSLMSKLSDHGASRHNGAAMDFSMHNSTHRTDSGAVGASRTNKESSMGSEFIGVGSRRSLMSGMSTGLSRIGSNHSDVFGDMGRKIATSSRSIAMSEISGIDEGFEGDDMGDFDEFGYDVLPSPRTPATARKQTT